jgi:hypothetical protein
MTPEPFTLHVPEEVLEYQRAPRAHALAGPRWPTSAGRSGRTATTCDKMRWLERLDDEEVEFVKRFILSSGSLKIIAKQYDISYPTIRLRLDRLIEKIKVWESTEIKTEFERTLLIEYAEGRITMQTLRTLLAAHKKEAASKA